MSAQISRRLENWGFVVRPTVPRQHCYSAEWQFAALRPFLVMGDLETDRRTPRRDVDHHDAWSVEVACRRLSLKQHDLLAAVYVYRAPPWVICRALRTPAGWRFRRLWAAVDQAETALALALLARSLTQGN